MADIDDMRSWIEELDGYLNTDGLKHHHEKLQIAKTFIVEELAKSKPLLSTAMVFIVTSCIFPLYEEMKSSDDFKFHYERKGLLMCYKSDKVGDRQVSAEQAKSWCAENGNIPYFETSALENTNVDDAFITMVKKALENQESDEMVMPDSIGGIGGNIQLNARTNS